MANKAAAPSAAIVYLWPDRILYLGPLDRVGAHRHAAAVWLVGLERDFRIALAPCGAWRTCRSALVGAGCVHRLDVGGARIASLYIDPEHDHPAFVQRQTGPSGMRLGLPAEVDKLRVFRDLWQERPGAEEAYERISALLEPERRRPELFRRLDTRVQRIAHTVRQATYENRPLAELSRAAGVSSTRLGHLFREHTGVPLRRYRTWGRLRDVARHYRQGYSLTQAALEAGFASSSHFTHAFQAMFGIKPSQVLRRGTTLELVLG